MQSIMSCDRIGNFVRAIATENGWLKSSSIPVSSTATASVPQQEEGTRVISVPQKGKGARATSVPQKRKRTRMTTAPQKGKGARALSVPQAPSVERFYMLASCLEHLKDTCNYKSMVKLLNEAVEVCEMNKIYAYEVKDEAEDSVTCKLFIDSVLISSASGQKQHLRRALCDKACETLLAGQNLIINGVMGGYQLESSGSPRRAQLYHTSDQAGKEDASHAVCCSLTSMDEKDDHSESISHDFPPQLMKYSLIVKFKELANCMRQQEGMPQRGNSRRLLKIALAECGMVQQNRLRRLEGGTFSCRLLINSVLVSKVIGNHKVAARLAACQKATTKLLSDSCLNIRQIRDGYYYLESSEFPDEFESLMKTQNSEPDADMAYNDLPPTMREPCKNSDALADGEKKGANQGQNDNENSSGGEKKRMAGSEDSRTAAVTACSSLGAILSNKVSNTIPDVDNFYSLADYLKQQKILTQNEKSMHQLLNQGLANKGMNLKFESEYRGEGKLLCKLFIEGVFVSEGVGKRKAVQQAASEVACEILLTYPWLSISRVNNEFHLRYYMTHLECEPNHFFSETADPMINILKRLDNCAAEIVKIAPKEDKKLQSSEDQGNTHGFILVDHQGEVNQSALTVLMRSAAFNQTCLRCDFMRAITPKKAPNRDGKVRCWLSLDEMVVGVMGSNAVDAEFKASEAALQYLHQNCWTLQVKEISEVVDSEISKEDIEKFDQRSSEVLSDSNIGYRMMRKMGWTGGGIGKIKGREEPLIPCPVFNQEGLGLVSELDSTRHFRRVIWEMLLQYAISEKEEDLTFSSEFSEEETQIISQNAKRLKLVVQQVGKKRKRSTLVGKKCNPGPLIHHLIQCGGETSRYVLLQPQTAHKDHGPSTSDHVLLMRDHGNIDGTKVEKSDFAKNKMKRKPGRPSLSEISKVKGSENHEPSCAVQEAQPGALKRDTVEKETDISKIAKFRKLASDLFHLKKASNGKSSMRMISKVLAASKLASQLHISTIKGGIVCCKLYIDSVVVSTGQGSQSQAIKAAYDDACEALLKHPSIEIIQINGESHLLFSATLVDTQLDLNNLNTD